MADSAASGNSTVSVGWGFAQGNALTAILMAQDIQIGAQPSYELCKLLIAYHPLGLKLTENPIRAAQSQQRRIVVAGAGKAEGEVIRAFRQKWKDMRCDRHIRNLGKLARGYGVAAMGLIVEGQDPATPISLEGLAQKRISINCWDPLNVSGSMVFNQDPNAADFQKPTALSVQGQLYHPSRTVGLLNEDPLFIEYTPSGYGYVGRSVFQRVLYPMKSYLVSMITNNQVLLKAGVLVVKAKSAGSPVDWIMQGAAAIKRATLKQAVVENIITVDRDDTVESLNFQNLDAPVTMARKFVLDDIATGADMPALMINQETFAEGFADGTEDSKWVADFVHGVREWLEPAYEFLDLVVMHCAWGEEWYKTIQERWPDQFGSVDYQTAFYLFKNTFQHEWPSLIQEPDSEKVKVDDVRLKAAIAVLELLLAMPDLGQENRAALIEWVMAVFDSLEIMFEAPLELDTQAIAEYEPPAAEAGAEGEAGGGVKPPTPAPPFSARDAAGRQERTQAQYREAVGQLYEMLGAREERRAKARVTRKAA